MRFIFTSLICAILSIAPGCASSKRTTVATITTVHQAMLAWRDYVAAGHATPQDEAKVKAAYEHYQATIRVAKAAFAAADANPSSSDLDNTINIVSASSSEIIALIRQFTSKKAHP